MKQKKRAQAIIINRELCKGCGICVAFCPKQSLALDKQDKSTVVDMEHCEACGMCELRCPDMAIEVIREADDTECSQ